MKRVALVLCFVVIFGIHCSSAEDEENLYEHGIISSLDSPEDRAKWWAYNGKIAMTKDPRNVKEGSGALEWRYDIRKQKWNLLARIKVDASQFKGRSGISLWIKSNKAGALLIQVPEKDGSNYQYLNFANPVELTWKQFKISFDEFKLDEDSSDENSRLDPVQIDRIEIVEVAGYFKTLPLGSRTVWIDDLRLLGESVLTPTYAQEMIGPSRATPGVSYEKGKFDLGILVDGDREKIIFPTKGNIHASAGTIEMWIKPLHDGTAGNRTLLSCEDPLDIFGRKGNETILYLQGRKVVFQVNKLSVSSPELLLDSERFHHLAVGWNSQGVALYIDGQRIAESSLIRSLGKIPKEMVIGNLRNGGAPCQVIIDELRVSRVKRGGKDIEASARGSKEATLDKDTLLLAHFNGAPLPEIDIPRQDFKSGQKIVFDVSIPTPVVPGGTKIQCLLRFEVSDGSNIVLRGEKSLALMMVDLSGQKNHAKFEAAGALKRGSYKLSLKLFAGETLLNRGDQVFSVSGGPQKDKIQPTAAPREKKGWFQNVQVYGMIPLTPQEAKRFNITVNGVWGGILTPGPILPAMKFSPSVRKAYANDAAYVSAMHNVGLLASGSIIAFSGHQSLIERWPELSDAMSRTARGDKARSWMEDAYGMSAHNPRWNKWMIEQGKRAIDAGADLIMVDDIQEFLFPFNFGFDQYAIDGFKKYLRSNFTVTELSGEFGISDIDNLDVARRISRTASRDYENRIEADPLVEVFARFHEENNYQTKKRLFGALRAYARERGKKVAMTANILGLATTRFQGYWSKGLYFSELVDFFAFENMYSIKGRKALDMRFPQGKWVAWEKLSRSATGSPAVPVVAAELLEKIAGRNIGNYLYILFAEAYANRSAMMLYHVPTFRLEKQWQKCGEAAGFVLSHRDIYNAEQSVYSPIAILYLYNEAMRTKTFAYLGFAQALAESNTPFEVVFSGDNHYLQDTLTLQELKKFKLILIPSVLGITDNQKEVVKRYVSEGGKAVILDPRELNIYRAEGEVKFAKGSFVIMPSFQVKGKLEDPGTAYLLTYNDTIRKNIENTVKTYVEPTVVVDGSDRKVIAYPYYQPQKERLVLHLVNYDHQFRTDRVNPKKNFKIKVKKPRSYLTQRKALMISPDFEGTITLPSILKGDYLEITVPELKVYGVIIF